MWLPVFGGLAAKNWQPHPLLLATRSPKRYSYTVYYSQHYQHNTEKTPMHPYLISLCEEYVQLVDMMRNGRYTATELRELDSERQTTHNQLCALTNLDPNDDMYSYAKAVLLAARGGGHRL